MGIDYDGVGGIGIEITKDVLEKVYFVWFVRGRTVGRRLL
jgi:hypothetical protein